MVNKIIIAFLLMASTAYAEITYVTVDDVKDHQKIASKLNVIIKQINSMEANSKKSISDVEKNARIQTNGYSKLITKCIAKGVVANHAEVTAASIIE